MRNIAIVLTLGLLIPILAYGQNDLTIEPFMISGKFLNESIKGDTLANGQRVNMNRTYVLRRGGMYFQNDFIQNTGYPLRIRAEYGSGVKPAIYAYRPTATTYPTQLFLADSTLTLSNLAISGWTDGGESFYFYVTQIITVARIGQSMTIDSCVLNGSVQRHIYINAAMRNVKITNTRFVNCGDLRYNNLGNGRAVDFRTVSVDTAFFQNCSFVNMHDRFIRHYGTGQAPINNFTLDHCTIFNDLAEHGCLGLGMVGSGKIQITNNLFVDNFIFGNDSTAYERGGEFADSGEKNPNGQFRMAFVVSAPNTTSKWVVANNYYSVSPVLQAFYDSRSGLPDAGVGNLIPLTWHINSKITDSTTAFRKVTTPIVFTNAPATPVNMAKWFFLPIAQGGSGKIKQNATFLPPYTADFDRKLDALGDSLVARSTLYFRDTMALSYPTTSTVYTGSAGSYPAGDLNWFPTRKAAWVTAGMPTTGVGNFGETNPTSFSLEQNYPNPFNPSTTFAFNMSKSDFVTISVFDILGRQVASLVNNVTAAGTHKVMWNAAGMSSGVYFYKMQAGSFTSMKKMILIR